VAVLAWDPPLGRTNHPGTEVPGEEIWFTLPPLAPPEVAEVLEEEHPDAATARKSRTPTGIRRVRSEPFPRNPMFPPVPFFGLDSREILPKVREALHQ
jgi:hypothetical protein